MEYFFCSGPSPFDSFVISRPGKLFCLNRSLYEIFTEESLDNDTSPSEKTKSSTFMLLLLALINIDPGLPASSVILVFSSEQTSYTAEPTVDVVAEPPCVGPDGRPVLPICTVILLAGNPITSVAIFVIIVAVPGPISLTEHCKNKLPSALSRALTVAPHRKAPKVPVP